MPDLQEKKTDFSILIDLWVSVYLIGLVCSKALLSIGMIGFCATAAFHWYKNADKSTARLRVYLFPCIILVVALFSGLNSSDLSLWSDFIIKKLPFLFLPLAFYSVRNHVASRYYDYLMGFVLLVGVVSLGVLGNYLMNFDDLNAAIGKGQAITTPIDHTEYSIFVAFAAIVSMFVFLEKKKVVSIGTKSTQLLISIFLILFLHILAVRSGLAVLYITAFLVGLYYCVKEKKYKILGGLVISMFLFPLIAINTIPSLKKKLSYVNWDLSQYKQGIGLNYSDSERIYSLRAGKDIFLEAPIVGVGLGDMRAKCNEKYQSYLGRTLKHYPHNQYLFTLASMGILGFLVSMFALLGPLYLLREPFDPYFLTLHSVVFVSALAENTLERTFSIGFYLFFVLTCICFLTRRWERQK